MTGYTGTGSFDSPEVFGGDSDEPIDAHRVAESGILKRMIIRRDRVIDHVRGMNQRLPSILLIGALERAHLMLSGLRFLGFAIDVTVLMGALTTRLAGTNRRLSMASLATNACILAANWNTALALAIPTG